jgi:hypothetical protein
MSYSNKLLLKPYSLMELSRIYGVDFRTFKKWIIPFQDNIGNRNGRYYTIAQVRKIFDFLGTPGVIED